MTDLECQSYFSDVKDKHFTGISFKIRWDKEKEVIQKHNMPKWPIIRVPTGRSLSTAGKRDQSLSVFNYTVIADHSSDFRTRGSTSATSRTGRPWERGCSVKPSAGTWSTCIPRWGCTATPSRTERYAAFTLDRDRDWLSHSLARLVSGSRWALSRRQERGAHLLPFSPEVHRICMCDGKKINMLMNQSSLQI